MIEGRRDMSEISTRRTEEVRAIRLGVLGEFEGQLNLTVDHGPDGLRGLAFTPEDYAAVAAIRPSRALRGPDALVTALGDQQAIWMVPAVPAIEDFDIRPVLRRGIDIIDVTEDGYRVRSADGAEFELTETQARVVSRIDGSATLAELARDVEREYRSDPDTKDEIAGIERETGVAFEQLLAEELVELCDVAVQTGAFTLEPAVRS